MPDNGVEDLRGHIDAAHAAADRLVQEATERARRADETFRERLGDVPERGWDVPQEDAQATVGTSELQTVVALLGTLRDAMPAELSQQLAEAVRELLLAVRALIDWYLGRLEQIKTRPAGGSGDDERVEEIPIS